MKNSKKWIYVIFAVTFLCMVFAAVFVNSSKTIFEGECSKLKAEEVKVNVIDPVETFKKTETAKSVETKQISEMPKADQNMEIGEKEEPVEEKEPVEGKGNDVGTTTSESFASPAYDSSSGFHNTFDAYVGRFVIPDVGVNVGCYSSNSQLTVDAIDSAAYYYNCGHIIVADHVNQGFNAIKYCAIGTKAYINSQTYTCVDIIQGHNTGYGLTDAYYNNIDGMYPGSLVCYTCNGSWQDITIAFFTSDDGMDESVAEAYWQSSSDQYNLCSTHSWLDWYELYESYSPSEGCLVWKQRSCRICGEEEIKSFPKFNMSDTLNEEDAQLSERNNEQEVATEILNESGEEKNVLPESGGTIAEGDIDAVEVENMPTQPEVETGSFDVEENEVGEYTEELPGLQEVTEFDIEETNSGTEELEDTSEISGEDVTTFEDVESAA